MKLSEARIRSIIRSKLLEALTTSQGTSGSVDPKISKEDLAKFLDGLPDGSVVELGGTSLKKSDGGFIDKSAPGPEEHSSSFNSSTVAAMILAHAVEGPLRDIESIEIFDANKQKVFAKSSTAKTAVGSEINPERAELLKWQKEVSARPLQLGSKGPNVGILQDLLENALSSLSSSFIALSPEAVSDVKAKFNLLVKPGKDGTLPSSRARGTIPSARIKAAPDAKYDTVNDIAGALTFSLDRDNDFGPVTRVAVYFFQHASNLQPDGRVGKDTAAALMKYAKPS